MVTEFPHVLGEPLNDSLTVFFEDNPSFWTGKVNFNNFNVTNLVDYGIAVHPALIGNGAARVTHKAAQNSEGVAYQVAHFDTPSIVPASEQWTLRLFRDQTVEEIIRTDDSNFLRQEDVTLTLH